jgi:hypothetical protein
MGGSCRVESVRSIALLAIRQREAPELEDVTIDPKSTALMVIDFLKVRATRSVVRDVSRPALMSRSCSTNRALMVFWCCTAYRRPVHPVIKAALGPPCRVDLNELKGGREWHRPSISLRLLQIGPKRPGHLPLENIEMMRRDSAERFSRNAKIEREVLGPRMREPVGDQQRVELRRFPVVEANNEFRAVIADTFQRVRHMPKAGLSPPSAGVRGILPNGLATIVLCLLTRTGFDWTQYERIAGAKASNAALLSL